MITLDLLKPTRRLKKSQYLHVYGENYMKSGRHQQQRDLYNSKNADLIKIRSAEKRKRLRKWKLENPDKAAVIDRNNWYTSMMYKYGLTQDQYDELILQSEGRCAICSKVDPELCVDHDHRTNLVRSLLCDRCNWMLGHSNEDLTVLRKAIEYLEKYSVV